ncbi:Myc-type, basic helix-loop-helix (bHLH) domain [Phytophthora cactorum]|nr:Myc-type, basic helix-loop-helix (bHLH) domain [Phytophthora cactorum]
MRYDQPPNDARPRLYAQPPGDYNQLMHPHHGAVKYEPGAPFYPPPAALHVSSDYQPPASSPASSAHSSAKRSREELNRKEKERIAFNQLKTLLDEAGVQTKKNKQSILDNTSHYIEMLRGDLVIAQQKAERAEKQAEAFRTQTHRGKGAVDKAVSGVFEKTTTPRVVVDMGMKTVMFNTAFLALKEEDAAAVHLCGPGEIRAIMTKLRETKQSVSALVKASATGKDEVASDPNGHATTTATATKAAENESDNDGKGSTAKGNKTKDQSAIYVQL